MEKCFVVFYECWDSFEILKVFMNEDDAIAFKEKMGKHHHIKEFIIE